jgi:urease subunit alpha
MSRRHHDARRRHRPGDRHVRDHLHAGPVAHRTHAQAADAFPMNLGFLGKGNASLPGGAARAGRGRRLGLKLHEDWGTTPAAIDCNCLSVADETTCRCDPHRHAERVGLRRGHDRGDSRAARSTPSTPRAPAAATRPTSSRSCGEPNVLPSSTNPTRPYTVNTLDEHLDMLMVCHHLDPAIAEDVAFAESRIRKRDDRRRGHPARPRRDLDDVVRQPGDGPRRRGDHPHLADRAQDEAQRGRCRATGAQRQLPRQALHRQVHDQPGDRARHRARVGSVEVGKLADLVLWKPAFFGVKPDWSSRAA